MKKSVLDYTDEYRAENLACAADPYHSTDRLIKLHREMVSLCSPQLQEYSQRVMEPEMLKNLTVAHKMTDGAREAVKFLKRIEDGIDLNEAAEHPLWPAMFALMMRVNKRHIEEAKKIEKNWKKGLDFGRVVSVKNRKTKAKEKSENIKKAIEDYIAYRIKNGINDFPRLKDISEHLKGQFVKQNKDDKDRYTEKSLMRAIEEIVPKIKAERSKNMSL